MVFKVLSFLIFLFFISRILISFYIHILYPICQFFKRKNSSGYVLSKYGKFEHREVVERLINRKLNTDEEVHHINGKPWDNRRFNLALMTKKNHRAWHKRLEYLFHKKFFPNIKWQRKILKHEFGARLF